MKQSMCEHWRDCGLIDGGCCAIGAVHQPSVGTCARCASFTGGDLQALRTYVAVRISPPIEHVAHDGGIVRWLGVDWFGVPMPIRLWRQWFFEPSPEGGYPGCGCIVWLKHILDRRREPATVGCGCNNIAIAA